MRNKILFSINQSDYLLHALTQFYFFEHMYRNKTFKGRGKYLKDKAYFSKKTAMPLDTCYHNKGD